MLPTSEFEPGVIGVCGCDSRPNLGVWDVRGISMEGLRELDGPICVIGDVDVLGQANVDMPGATVSMPSGAVVDANTGNVEVDAEDEE